MRAVLEISGMTCGHCEAAVKKALAAVPGVEGAPSVDRANGRAVVELGQGRDGVMSALKKAIEDEGYDVVSAREETA